jgi:O-Antigen ligase
MSSSSQLRAELPSRLSELAHRWDSLSAASTARILLLLALSVSFLSAAGTLEVGFTVAPSYLLCLGAVAAGLPSVWRGWRLLPDWLGWLAAALLVSYMIAAVVGHPHQLPSGGSRAHFRGAIYVCDLALGLGVIGLCAGLLDTRIWLRRAAIALVGAGALAAVYGLYQWFAQRYGWPAADLNTAPNSDGFSHGHRFQGFGLFGWERIRGTFKEPLIFGTFLGMVLPIGLAVAATSAGTRRRGVAYSTVAATAVAIGLTASWLSWGVTLLAFLVTLTLASVAYGRVSLSALLGAALVVAAIAGPVVFTNPSVVAGLSGRSGSDLRLTTENRTNAWHQAIRVWEQRPLIGQGPGQSAVRLAYRPEGAAIRPGLRAPIVYGSAQGLWAASLVDAGLFGLAAWTGLLLGLLGLGAIMVWHRPSALGAALLAAATVAVISGQLLGDRLDLRVWLALGLLAAAAAVRPVRQQHSPNQGGKPDSGAD